MNAVLRFDLVKRESDPGSKGTEIAPDIRLRFSGKAMQFNMGYRRRLSDTTTISGTTTSTRSSDTSEAVADTTIRAGRLPNVRLRYARRDRLDETDGATTSDSTTDDARGAVNYKFGILAANADYSWIRSKDNATGTTNENTQFTGQIAAAKKFSPKVRVTARENYSFADTKNSVAGDTSKSTSISEAKLNLSPINRMGINVNYLHRIQKQDLAKTTEDKWVTAANYSLPRFFRFYGKYQTRQNENQNSILYADSTVMGVNFKHSVDRFGFSARYERRIDTNDREFKNGNPATHDENIRTNIDWLLNANLTRYLKATLSEAYVINETGSGRDDNNKFRLKVNIGPIGRFVMGPYIDYTVATNKPLAGRVSKSTSTDLVVPASYNMDFGGKIQLSLTDNYVMRTTENDSGSKTSSSSNNAVIRVSIPRLIKSVRFTGDASFNTSSSGGTTTSNSSYTARITWMRKPHTLNTNLRYQTGSGRTSTFIGTRYGLNLRLKKATLSFSAQYTYGISTGRRGSSSTSQSMFFMFNFRN